MGETAILAGADGGNAGLVLEQDAVLAQGGTLQTLSMYFIAAAGNVRLGVYDSTNHIIVQTASFAPVAGWNTQPVGHMAIPAGTYRLAYEPSSGNLTFPVDQGSGSCRWAAQAFGAMPATFPPIAGSNSCHWSLYATLSVP